MSKPAVVKSVFAGNKRHWLFAENEGVKRSRGRENQRQDARSRQVAGEASGTGGGKGRRRRVKVVVRKGFGAPQGRGAAAAFSNFPSKWKMCSLSQDDFRAMDPQVYRLRSVMSDQWMCGAAFVSFAVRWISCFLSVRVVFRGGTNNCSEPDGYLRGSPLR